jgi:outer membrane protein assembly factor BamD
VTPWPSASIADHAHRRALGPLVCACVIAAGAGCSAFETNLQDTEVEYSETARKNYEMGQEAMEDETYNEAIKFFEYVKNKYPYSKYAVLADLRVADAHFAREKWLEAADAYRLFVRFHPSNENVPLASYRIALSYYNETSKEAFADIPVLREIVDFINPFPPARERDQTATQDAIKAFDEYLKRFPDHENVEEAKELRIKARTRLADHDLYAAEFYAERSKWTGAMWRYQKIADDFGDTPLAAASLLTAGEIAEEELDDLDQARSYYQRIIDEYPEAPEADGARSALARLKTKQGPALPDDEGQVVPEGGAEGQTPAADPSAPAADADKASPTP